MSQAISYGDKMQGGASAKLNAKSAQGGGVSVRNIALPVEHGGWGFSLEPVLLGLLLAPSLAGLFLAMATMGVFLARHPLKMVMGDHRRGRRLRRTPIAERFALLYISIAAISFLAAFKTSSSYEFLLPLLVASPLALVQLVYDRLSRSRELLPELAGAIAMASIVASIALADGWSRSIAFGLWAILIARVVPTILYVRARLKMLHEREASIPIVILTHALALCVAVVLALTKLSPALSAVAFLILLLRALYGFSRYDQATTAKQIGIRELSFGAMIVGLVALGHYFKL
jgi:uncharacterized membrane protein